MPKKKFQFVGSRQGEQEWIQMIRYEDKISKLVGRAQYLRAYKVACEAIKVFPKNRFAQYEYAVMLGDSSEWASSKRQRQLSKKAAYVLKGLLARSRGIDSRWVDVWKNEYYWFSKQPQKQYRLGVSRVRRGQKGGYYSMGVGAVAHALNIYGKNSRLGRKWALASVEAWESYFKINSKYYNSYVWYARALGLSGNLPKMELAFKKAARLSRRPLSYQEFIEARKDVLGAIAQVK